MRRDRWGGEQVAIGRGKRRRVDEVGEGWERRGDEGIIEEGDR